MMQKAWFKIFIWFLTTFFFFLAAGVVISLLKPGPSQSEVMKFMSAMMGTMDGSMMGLSMSIESNSGLSSIIKLSSFITIPVIVISIIAGLAIKTWQRGDKNA